MGTAQHENQEKDYEIFHMKRRIQFLEQVVYTKERSIVKRLDFIDEVERSFRQNKN